MNQNFLIFHVDKVDKTFSEKYFWILQLKNWLFYLLQQLHERKE